MVVLIIVQIRFSLLFWYIIDFREDMHALAYSNPLEQFSAAVLFWVVGYHKATGTAFTLDLFNECRSFYILMT